MAKTKKNDSFDKLHPSDGIRIKRVQSGDRVSLHVGIWQEGELINPFGATPEAATEELAEGSAEVPAELGRLTRLELVVDSVARYLTTGGNWDELQEALRRMQVTAPGGLSYPGYELLDSYSDTAGNYEHIFVRSGTNDAVLWVEDEFIDRKTLEQIRREQESDWDGDVVDEEDSVPDLLRLSDPGDEGEADEDAADAEEPPAGPG